MPGSWALKSFQHLVNERFIAEMSTSLFESEDRELRRLLFEVKKLEINEDSGVSELREYRALLMRVASHLSAQARIRKELRSLALTDDLTGFYNRRGFLILGQQLLRFARRSEEPALLLFADVDRLKQVNDQYGHAEGDVLLIRCAQILKETFRESDIVARLGGDEFTILALETRGESSESIVRRLEHAIHRSNEAGFFVKLSLSIGIARFEPENPASLADLMARADRSMYEKKRTRPANPVLLAAINRGE